LTREADSLFRLLGVEPRAAARLAMTSGLGLEELAQVLSPHHEADLSEIVANLRAEVASVTLFDDVADSLARLRRLGLKLWVASNLAPLYAVPLRTMLGDLVDGFCFSFEAGSIKPESEFFGRLCSVVRCAAALALMAGDSLRSDVEGARAAGMQAVHLARDSSNASPSSVRSLGELAGLIERGMERPSA
jgi:FMN phosphatase YigB (HAD superfamily)